MNMKQYRKMTEKNFIQTIVETLRETHKLTRHKSNDLYKNFENKKNMWDEF